MKIIGLEGYRKTLTEYARDINDEKEYQKAIEANEEQLINWAIIDAMNYYWKLKKEQP